MSVSRRRFRNTALALVAFAVAGATSCKKGEAVSGEPLTAAETAALYECARGLEAIAGADPWQRAELLAAACPLGNEALARLPHADPTQRLAILAAAGAVCSAGGEAIAASSPRDTWSALLRACGRESFGLAEGAEIWLSVEWILVQNVANALGAMRARATPSEGPLFETIDQAAKELRIPLPPPTGGDGWRVPASQSPLAAPIASTTYVFVANDRVAVGTLAHAVMTHAGAAIVDGPTGPFPGETVAIEQLEPRVAVLSAEPARPDTAMLETLLQPEEAAAADAREGGTAQRHRGEEGKMGGGNTKRPAGRYAIAGPEMGEPDLASPNRIAVAGPVLIADAAVPATRLLDAARSMPTRDAFIGVAIGRELGTHAVYLGAVAWLPAPDDQIVPPVEVTLEDGKVSARGGGRAVVVLGPTDATALRDLLGTAVDSAAPVTVRASGSATVAELVAVLDILAEAGVRKVVPAAP